MRFFLALTLYVCSFTLNATNWQHSYFLQEPSPMSTMAEGNITKKQFKGLLKKIKKTYRKTIHKRGGLFKIKAKWKSNRVNAYASRIGPIWKLTALGGLARHPMINYDGFALVLCHEMGHHLGGAPKSATYFKRWVSFEGQADYWATLKCFRTLFEQEDNIQFLTDNEQDIPVWASLNCMDAYPDKKQSALCIRSIMAGKTMANLIAEYRHVDFPLLDTPDMSEVEKTDPWHPTPQCRLDTYAQAAICQVNHKVEVSDTDPNIGTCNRQNGDTDGVRPLCWFKPL